MSTKASYNSANLYGWLIAKEWKTQDRRFSHSSFKSILLKLIEQIKNGDKIDHEKFIEKLEDFYGDDFF